MYTFFKTLALAALCMGVVAPSAALAYSYQNPYQPQYSQYGQYAPTYNINTGKNINTSITGGAGAWVGYTNSSTYPSYAPSYSYGYGSSYGSFAPVWGTPFTPAPYSNSALMGPSDWSPYSWGMTDQSWSPAAYSGYGSYGGGYGQNYQYGQYGGGYGGYSNGYNWR